MSHIRNSSPPTFHPDVSHPEFFSAAIPPGYLASRILLRCHSTRISHIRNYVRPTFNLLRISHIRNSVPVDVQPSPDISHPEFCSTDVPPSPDILHPEFCPADIPPYPDISHPDGRGGHFNFPGQICPDPLIVLTQRASAADNSDSPDSLARQTLAIRRIHFRPQSKSKLR